MTTPFDTTRLDDECERIAKALMFRDKNPTDADVMNVRRVLLGRSPKKGNWTKETWLKFATRVYNLCRRPKMVKA